MFPKTTHIHIFTLATLLQACSSPLSERSIHKNSLFENPESLDSFAPNAISPIDIEPFTYPNPTTSTVEESLSERMSELVLLDPAGSNAGWDVQLGYNLHKNQAEAIELSLREALLFSAEHNLDVKLTKLQPLIGAEATVASDAAFDFIFGAEVSLNDTNTPQQQIVVGGNPVNSAESKSDQLVGGLSLVKQLYSGGKFSLSTDLIKTKNEGNGTVYSPDPAWQAIGSIDYTQPLLRNFGEEFARSQIYLAEISYAQNFEDLREALHSTIKQTEHSYLNLALQWKTLQIKTWLLKEGVRVENLLKLRRDYDTGEADYAQAVATVQQRRADVINQQSLVQKSSDTLKQLMNSPTCPVESEDVIQPKGPISATEISISFREAVLTALQNRPDLQKLLLSIDSESIRVDVAENATLPQLDLQTQMSFYGLGDNAGDGYEEVFNTDYINYLAGLSFEIPLGNRAASANYTSARLQKLSAVTTYKKGIQTAIIEIKSALRDIVTNAALMGANRDFRIAQTENLRALTVEEETMAGLTPTFLNLKLQTQSGLASSKIAEFNSIIEYNKAIASLYEAMGTTLLVRGIEFNKNEQLLP